MSENIIICSDIREFLIALHYLIPAGNNKTSKREKVQLAKNAEKFFTDPCTIRTFEGYEDLMNQAKATKRGHHHH